MGESEGAQHGLDERRVARLDAGPVEWFERGDGEPLLLLHGLVLSATFWRKTVPGLAEHFRCLTPTLPLGAHRSAMDPDADLSPPGIADLVVRLLDDVGVDRVTVLGNDTGGAIAQVLTARHPDRVRELVLTPCDAFDHFLPWQFKHLQVLARVPGAAWQTARLLQSPRFRGSALGFGLLTKYGVPVDVSAEWVRPIRDDAGVRRDLVKVLRGISTRHTRAAAEGLTGYPGRALVLWATEDRVFPRADAERLASLLPNGRLELVDGSRTYLPEDQPGALVDAVLRFAREDGSAA